MIKNNKLRIPKMPHSIDNAAKTLGIDKDNIITWILDGSIRACINYRTFYSDFLTYSVAVLSDYTNTIEDYKQYRNDEFATDCPLSNLLSTTHSTMLIHTYSVPLKSNDNCVPFSADLKGLWHIKDLEDVKALYDNPTYVTLVPYLPYSIYNSDINDEMTDYILGFSIKASFDDIYISYEDVLRLEGYYYGNSDLLTLDASKPCDEKEYLGFTPTEQISMAFIQLILSNPNLGSEYIEHPTSSLRLIEYELKGENNRQLNSTDNTFRQAITEGKYLLEASIIPKRPNNKVKPRKPYLNKCKTLIQLIEIHPLITFKSIDDIEKSYGAINQMLCVQGMSEFKVNKDTFQYACEQSK